MWAYLEYETSTRTSHLTTEVAELDEATVRALRLGLVTCGWRVTVIRPATAEELVQDLRFFGARPRFGRDASYLGTVLLALAHSEQLASDQESPEAAEGVVALAANFLFDNLAECSPENRRRAIGLLLLLSEELRDVPLHGDLAEKGRQDTYEKLMRFNGSDARQKSPTVITLDF